jgi:hypothetical protein
MQNNARDNQRLLESLVKRLSPDEKKKLNSILADKSACEKVLRTPEAQQLIRKLGGK